MEYILFILAVPILLIGYLIHLGSKISNLEKRVKDLEFTSVQSASQVEKQTVTGAVPMPATSATEVPTSPMYSPQAVTSMGSFEKNHYTPQVAQHHHTVPQSNAFIDWLKEDFFVKLGGLLLLLAVGWFVSYAIINQWIGPAGQITLGVLLGVIVIAGGWWRIQKFVHQGSIFTALGATIIILTIFAGREVYDFFTPALALVMMFVTVVYVTFVSLRFKRQQLAIAGLLLGMSAPLFTAAVNPDLFGLFSYLLVVVLGALWVVYYTGWTKLIPIALTVVFFWQLPFLDGGVSAADQGVALVFALLFVSVFYITNIISMMRRLDVTHFAVHIYTAAGTALYLLVWVLTVVPEEWRSLMFVTWALVFSVGAYFAYRFSANRTAFYIYAGTGVALIAAATAAELEGPALTIAYIVEICALLMAVAALRAESKLFAQLSLLYIVPMLMSFESMDSYLWSKGIFHSAFAVIFLLTLSFACSGFYLFLRHTAEAGNVFVRKIGMILLALAGCYAVVLVWLSFHALFVDMLATLLSLMLYTICGIALFVNGKVNNRPAIKAAGVVLISLVVARLLFIDVWDMSLIGRIVTFFVIGVMLISTAFIKQSAKPAVTSN